MRPLDPRVETKPADPGLQLRPDKALFRALAALRLRGLVPQSSPTTTPLVRCRVPNFYVNISEYLPVRLPRRCNCTPRRCREPKLAGVREPEDGEHLNSAAQEYWSRFHDASSKSSHSSWTCLHQPNFIPWGGN